MTWRDDDVADGRFRLTGARRNLVAEVRIQDGIIKVVELDIQDPRAAAVLAEYPEARWAEVTRRALKIGLGYLKGGAQD
jgi:hypothetical protein